MKHLFEVCLVAFTLTASITPLAAAQSPTEKPMQKGISVELAVTSNATPVPDVDKDDSLIVTVTAAGCCTVESIRRLHRDCPVRSGTLFLIAKTKLSILKWTLVPPTAA